MSKNIDFYLYNVTSPVSFAFTNEKQVQATVVAVDLNDEFAITFPLPDYEPIRIKIF